jgi:5-hydroxyisourate hydrolase
MAGRLTTHVLDIAGGCPAVGMRVGLFRGSDLIASGATNADGRLDRPLVEGTAFAAGAYRLEFGVGDYFAGCGHIDARRFLDVVVVQFVVDDPSRGYHVPLLVSPWAYSTYRGS